MKKIEDGYVLEARQSFESDIWKKPAWWYKVWRYLIMRVNWQENKRAGIAKGEGWFTYRGIYEDCHLATDHIDEKSITRVIQWLKSSTQISTTKSTRGFKISIVNYSTFQDKENYQIHSKIHSKIHSASTAGRQPVHTITKEGNKGISNTTPLPPSQAWEDIEPEQQKPEQKKLTQNEKPYVESIPLGVMICDFKEILKIARHDRDWDRLNYKRHIKACEDILKAFQGDFPYARRFLIEESISMRDWAAAEGHDWSINAIARKAWNTRGKYLENKASKEKKTHAESNCPEALGAAPVPKRKGTGGLAPVGNLADSFKSRCGKDGVKHLDVPGSGRRDNEALPEEWADPLLAEGDA